tara:strand:- start:6266 stop:6781 length:516 start_codon:yes stop_codon:yes gene_type:complete
MNKDIRQFKLLNGEEIICEIIDHILDDDENEHGEGFNMWVKSAMKLELKINDYHPDEEPYRFYALNPWMVYGEDEHAVVSIRSEYVMAETIPSPMLLDQYIVGMRDMNEGYKSKMLHRERLKEEMAGVEDALKKVADKMREKIDASEDRLDINNVFSLFNNKGDKDDGTVH